MLVLGGLRDGALRAYAGVLGFRVQGLGYLHDYISKEP